MTKAEKEIVLQIVNTYENIVGDYAEFISDGPVDEEDLGIHNDEDYETINILLEKPGFHVTVDGVFKKA